MGILSKVHNKAFKSDSQRLAVSLRSSIAKRRSHLNAALYTLSSMEALLKFISTILGFIFCFSAGVFWQKWQLLESGAV
ncbi:hypothetical protein BST55_24600, partial [Vibrio vulnificus]